MEAQNRDYNVNVIRSVWHRVKKGHVEIRDLDPKKDVKGGAGVTGNSNPSQAAPAHQMRNTNSNRL
jgi:hypothetical protein